MTQSIHGHQVMEMMTESKKTYSKQALQTEIANQFGKDARFHTCMDSDLTATQLIVLLTSKGKFVESADGISMSKEHGC